jgi:hypothetical protein
MTMAVGAGRGWLGVEEEEEGIRVFLIFFKELTLFLFLNIYYCNYFINGPIIM